MEPDLDQILQENFGFAEFREGQRQVIETLLTEGKALAVFPTGSGKSLCYQLPALALDGVTLVVSPLIALMKDQIDFLRRRGIAAARLDSSLSAGESREVHDGLRAGTLKLLYVAPERFNNERFLEELKRMPIALFAVDEAHCISEWGHNFRPDYLKLAQFAAELKVPRILALTATATPAVSKSICAGFGIPENGAVITGFYRPNLRFSLVPCPAPRRERLLLDRLAKRPPGSTIVYVTLQKTAEHLAQVLADAGLEARPYHAGLESLERSEIQDWWMGGSSRIVVATVAFGMGIDRSDVRYVYHFNLPKGLENYSQEVGRAGRDGKPSTVELFACRDDVRVLENFVYGDSPTPEALEALVEYLLGAGEEVVINNYELSQRFDLRPLVLKTALTYLELLGVFRQGTPFYATYEARLFGDVESTCAAFSPKAGDFLRSLLKVSVKGKTWWKVDPEAASAKLNVARSHVVRAMELLETRNLAEVRAADSRMRLHRVAMPAPSEDEEFEAEELAAELVSELAERFLRREENEIARIQDVLALVEHPGCQTNALVGHFGEIRPAPCGHCSFCVTGRASLLPPEGEPPELHSIITETQAVALQREYPAVLGHPRQLARFLCGLNSPATSKARLGRHPRFGCLEEAGFATVFTWCRNLG